MTKIYRSLEFSFTQAAVDQIGVIRDDYLRYFPDNPPVLAGISTGYQITPHGPGPSRVIIGFWQRSEVSAAAWEENPIVEVAGQKFLFTVMPEFRQAFLDAVIDYSPQEAFVLRQLPQTTG